MNKNGVIAVVVVVAAVVLIGLWAMGSGQQGGNRADCNTAPSAPTNLTHSKTGDMVTLNWAAAGGGETVTTYVVEAGSAPGTNNQGTFVAPGTSTSFQRQAPAGVYYVRMFARNACGTSPASSEIVVTVP
jgi:hypothetical protein